MNQQSAVINRIDTEIFTLTSALAELPKPNPWDHIPPKTQAAETIEAITKSFGILVNATSGTSDILANTIEGAEYAEQALALTMNRADRAQQETGQAAPSTGRRYPDVSAAKHAAKANNYTAQASADASLAEKAAQVTTAHRDLLITICNQVHRAAELVYLHAAQLPQEYEESARIINHKTLTIVEQITAGTAQADQQAGKARAAADRARELVQAL